VVERGRRRGPDRVGQRHPQLYAVEQARRVGRGHLGVADAVGRRHHVEL